MKAVSFVLLLIVLLHFNAHAQLNPSWVSYYGGDSTRIGSVKYDKVNSCVYIAGITNAQSNMASTGAHQPNYGGGGVYPNNTDGFLAKFDTSGQRIWATYYGGSGAETLSSIAIDTLGNVYICGTTSSPNNIASAGSFMPQKLSATVFLAKFNTNGQRLWGTYYGSTSQVATGSNFIPYPRVVVDKENNVYLSGNTTDVDNIATPGTHQLDLVPNPSSSGLPIDAFIAKFNAAGQRLWGTYYGGSGQDFILGMCTDNNGDLYVTGTSNSNTGIATPGVGVSFSIGYSTYSILAKFNKNGQRIWGGYWAHAAIFTSVATDNAGNIYTFGTTFTDSLIGTPGTHQPDVAGAGDAIIMKFNAQGQKQWGSYYGGSNYDGHISISNANDNSVPGFGLISPMQNTIAIKEDGKKKSLIIGGGTLSTNGINFTCPYEGRDSKKGFVASFDADTGTINWGTYYDALVGDLSLDDNGNLYIAGYTPVDSVATANSFLSTKPTNKNAGLFGKFTTCPQVDLSIVKSADTLYAPTGYTHYTWYKDGIVVGTGSDHYWVLAATSNTGNYHVEATNACKCVYTSNTINIEPTAIGNRYTAWQNLRVYPNPTNGAFIFLDGLPITQTNYQINDLAGRTISQGSCNNKKNSIDVSTLTLGVYLLHLASEGSSIVIKIAKK